MAGKIIADTIETGAGADISTSYVVNGSAKAYAHLDTDAVLDKSFNVSSATDVATSDFSLSITNAFYDAESIVTGSVVGATLASYGVFITSQGVVKTSSLIPFKTLSYYDSIGSIDMHKMQLVIHGELA